MYAAQLGRFLQTDPEGDTDSPNLHQYVLWDPISNKDPSGLESDDGRFHHTDLDQGAEEQKKRKPAERPCGALCFKRLGGLAFTTL